MIDIPRKMPSSINERLARHFLRRLGRTAETAAIDRAITLGILKQEYKAVDGHDIGFFKHGHVANASAETEIRRILWRRRRGVASQSLQFVSQDDEIPLATVAEERPPRDGEFSAAENPISARIDDVGKGNNGQPLSIGELVRMVPSERDNGFRWDVVTLLLLAQAIPSGISLQEALGTLDLIHPIIIVCCEVPGFEDSFLDLLERGLILPGQVTFTSGYEINRWRSGFHFSQVINPKWQVICFSGQEQTERRTTWQIGHAAQTVFPILGVSEKRASLPAQLLTAAHLHLDCGQLNTEIVSRTIRFLFNAM